MFTKNNLRSFILIITLTHIPLKAYAVTEAHPQSEEVSCEALVSTDDQTIIDARIYEIWKESLWRKTVKCGVVGLSLGIPYAANELLSKWFPTWYYTITLFKFMTGGVQLVFSAQMITSLFDKDVRNFLEWTSTSGNQVGTENELRKDVESRRFQFEKEQPTMNLKTVERLNELFSDIDKIYWNLENNPLVGGFTSRDGELKNIRQKLTTIEWILNMPFGSKKFVADQAMVERINEALKTVQDSARKGIRDFTSQLKIASQLKRVHKPVVSFIGAPGTGKTTAARKYAKALGKDLIEINLRGQTLEKIFGSSNSQQGGFFGLGGQTSDVQTGLLAKSLSFKGQGKERLPKDSIIFLDEFEKSINAEGEEGGPLTATFLKLLDSNEETIYIADLDIEIDMREHIFILASNEPLKNKPLASRIRFHVEFPPFEKDQKLTIAKNYFSQLLTEYNMLMDQNDEETLLEIVEKDENPGVRVLEFILQDYLAFKLGKIDWGLGETTNNHFNVTEAIKNHVQ